MSKYSKAYYAKNKDKINARKREWRKRPEVKAREKAQYTKYWAKHGAAKKERTQEYRKSRPEIVADYHRKHKYGLTAEQYAIIRDRQNNLCAICFQPETSTLNGKVRNLAVDHNHITTKVRALLCSSCNAHIGYVEKFQANPEFEQRLKEYLLKHKESNAIKISE